MLVSSASSYSSSSLSSSSSSSVTQFDETRAAHSGQLANGAEQPQSGGAACATVRKIPAWFGAVGVLMECPEQASASLATVQRFSERGGCLAAVSRLTQEASNPGSDAHGASPSASQVPVGEDGNMALPVNTGVCRPQRMRHFQLGDAYRYWGDPLVSAALRVKTPLRDVLPTGEDGFRMGGVAVSISEKFHALYAGDPLARTRAKPRECTARLYSRFGGFSPAGQWHANLAELSQDLYLKDILSELPRRESVRSASETAPWPTLVGPSLMTLEHGTGVPVMQVNGQRVAVGFSDVVAESLINVEGRLFSNWLLMQSRSDGARWSEAQLDSVLTPALTRWVCAMRNQGVASGSRLWSSWFSFLQKQVNSFSSGGDSGDWMGILNHEFEQMRIAAEHDLNGADLEEWLDACPVFTSVVEGLVIVQDAVFHGGGHLPPAGLERAYLNALLRNMTCAALGLHEPAEIAQFDLLLLACRRSRNEGFNDHSANQAMENHHRWVSVTQSGNRGSTHHALKQLTLAYTRAADDSDHACMFTLDEPSRSSATDLA